MLTDWSARVILVYADRMVGVDNGPKTPLTTSSTGAPSKRCWTKIQILTKQKRTGGLRAICADGR
jgi:hypothetical protein